MLSSPMDAETIAASIRKILAETSDPSCSAYDSSRLTSLSARMGKEVGLADDRIKDLVLAARVFDVGAAWTPGQTLLKKGALVEAEWAEVTQHVAIGQQVAESTPGMEHLAVIILHHHEWWDGPGYPGLLSGAGIPLESRILAIVDAYDAMVSGRPYRKALTHDQALVEIKRCAGSQFDPNLVEVFLRIAKG